MKTNSLLLALCLMVMISISGAAQDKEPNYGTVKLFAKQKPYLVLKVNDRVLEFKADDQDGLDLDKLDAINIESMQVLKDKEAFDQYAENGKNGVVIITFKNFDNLPHSLQDQFNAKGKQFLNYNRASFTRASSARRSTWALPFGNSKRVRLSDLSCNTNPFSAVTRESS
jgi:hypothetical protein